MKIQQSYNDEHQIQKLLRNPKKGNFSPIHAPQIKSTISRENWLDHKISFQLSSKSESLDVQDGKSKIKPSAMTSDTSNTYFRSYDPRIRQALQMPEYIYVDSDDTFLLKLKLSGTNKQLQTLRDRVKLLEMELDSLIFTIEKRVITKKETKMNKSIEENSQQNQQIPI